MPARNVVKEYVPESYYHVYNRGVSKQTIFHDDQDYTYFLSLLQRYLSPDAVRQPKHKEYTSYSEEVKLVAYCLMTNHFHLFMFQITDDGMKKLMKSISVSYGMYYNRRYRHTGAVFQQRYRAVRMVSDAQFDHICRYIHLNPRDYRSWPWSSLGYTLGEKSAYWMSPELVPVEPTSYLKSLQDYSQDEHLQKLKQIFDI